MATMDLRTGRPLVGWPAVAQSLEVIFSTRIGERVMRRWVGSNVPGLLGQLAVPATFLRFATAIFVAVELYEPRFRVMRVLPTIADRLGRTVLAVEGEYRPRALDGDLTPERGIRTLVLSSDGVEAM